MILNKCFKSNVFVIKGTFSLYENKYLLKKPITLYTFNILYLLAVLKKGDRFIRAGVVFCGA